MDTKKLLYELEHNKVEHLGIDIDRASKYDLMLTYFKCKKAFPESPITMEISASGKGFHVIVQKEMTVLENIMWRARFGDDQRRLMFSLAKFAHDPEIPFFDLIFSKKYGKNVTQIEIEELLEPHKETVQKIMDSWGTDEALALLKELSDNVEIKVERYWTTSIKIPEKSKDALVKKMNEIAMVDETWKWRVFPNFLGHGYILIVYSPDMDHAHRRGVWLINKVDELKGYKYWVRRI